MSKPTNYSDKVQGLADRMKNQPVRLPMQQLTPVEPVTSGPSNSSAKASSKVEQEQLTVFLPKIMMRQLRVRSAETGIKQKDLVQEALMQYLKQ